LTAGLQFKTKFCSLQELRQSTKAKFYIHRPAKVGCDVRWIDAPKAKVSKIYKNDVEVSINPIEVGDKVDWFHHDHIHECVILAVTLKFEHLEEFQSAVHIPLIEMKADKIRPADVCHFE
jgi:hypothetical protein